MSTRRKGAFRLEMLVTYQWEIFIALEVLSVVSLILFGFLRYVVNKRKISMLAIAAFLGLLLVEAAVALLIYNKTKEMSTFQIVVIIFLLYACTFGILDFLKLDRWMRKTVGKWRGVELLTEKDYRTMEWQKDPVRLARKYRITSTIHLLVFVVIQGILWWNGTGSMETMTGYLTDLSWIESGSAADSPYANDTVYSFGVIWMLVFVVDFIYSWSYTFFPSKK